MIEDQDFLPVSQEEMHERGWWWYDFLLVTGDAYVDHPSFGPAVIGRVLEADGFRVAVLAQPDWHSAADFAAFGRPRLGVLIGAGNLDSMVAHYTAAKKRRSEDFYSPGKKAGLRPDRATIVYSNRAREAFGADVPIIIGGLEASLRRFAHYDYWDGKVRRSILVDSGADMLVYGMAEYAEREIAKRLKKKIPVSEMRDIRGTAFLAHDASECAFDSVTLPSFADVCDSKRFYADATRIEYAEHDPVRGRALIQEHDGRYLIVNPPAMPLETKELDRVAELPYTKQYHPMYEPLGGVPAIEEVKFSVIHNRGCFGYCNFCSIALHQGRRITCRSEESILEEAKKIIAMPNFKGYIHDVGGPTANFRLPSCKKQATHGMCPGKKCLAPEPCKALQVDHTEYLSILRKLRALPGVKRVFIRSGIRFDYVMADKDDTFFKELVSEHVSGQLKVAPEHVSNVVLDKMGKPHIECYEAFQKRFYEITKSIGKKQYLVPYLMSSHPGSTLAEAVKLSLFLRDHHMHPEQVQDFYPTPGTISTCMYYTELDPYTMEPVYVPKTPQEKAMQRALLQYYLPQNRQIVLSALRQAGRQDLIGTRPGCLVAPDAPAQRGGKSGKPHSSKGGASPRNTKKSTSKKSRRS